MHVPAMRVMASDPAATARAIAASPIVPGLAVAGVVDGEVTVAAAGVADAETGREVLPDTVFRPGSITKLLTATLVAQCVEDGLLSLDDPIATYVPDLRLDGRHAVTVRHLVTHSSGIDAGDLFVDTGDDDGAVGRYVEQLNGTGFLFTPGSTFSYCNAAFVIAGHIVERVRDASFEDLMRERLFEPLGMGDSGFVPGGAWGASDRERRARGHNAGFGPVTPLAWELDYDYTVRGLGPAGGTFTSTAGDLGRFLVDHLARPERAWMRALAVPAPGGVTLMQGPAAGWMVWYGSYRIGGANPGMSGYVAIDEDARAGIVALTNSDAGVNAVAAAIDAEAPPAPDAGPPFTDLHAVEGEYASHAMRVTVEVVDGVLTASINGMVAPLTPRDATTVDSMLGPVAFFDGLARWRMRVLRRLD